MRALRQLFAAIRRARRLYQLWRAHTGLTRLSAAVVARGGQLDAARKAYRAAVNKPKHD